ncbi:unnamed protein product [Symbiodinium sp. CCMP2592]|nr:unnamed protein product [Symbiodinium sp. CCMP2592]
MSFRRSLPVLISLGLSGPGLVAPAMLVGLYHWRRWSPAREPSVVRLSMDSVYGSFHPNFPGAMSAAEKRSLMETLLAQAKDKAEEQGWKLGKDVQDFHKRKGWNTRELLRWIEKRREGLWCRLDISVRGKSKAQLTVISAPVWGYDMEVHLSKVQTGSNIVVVKDLINLRTFCAVAGIGYVKAKKQ